MGCYHIHTIISDWRILVVSLQLESACNVRDLGSIPGLGRSPGEGKGYPLQYSDLENSMDCTVHGVTKSWTWLSDFHFHFSARNITGSCQATVASPAPNDPFQQQYKGDHSPSVCNTHWMIEFLCLLADISKCSTGLWLAFTVTHHLYHSALENEESIGFLGLSEQNTTDWVAWITEICFPTGLEARSPRWRCWQRCFLLRPLFLAWRWMLSCCVLRWSLLFVCMLLVSREELPRCPFKEGLASHCREYSEETDSSSELLKHWLNW